MPAQLIPAGLLVPVELLPDLAHAWRTYLLDLRDRGAEPTPEQAELKELLSDVGAMVELGSLDVPENVPQNARAVRWIEDENSLSTSDYATRHGLTVQHVRRLCKSGTVLAAKDADGAWRIQS